MLQILFLSPYAHNIFAIFFPFVFWIMFCLRFFPADLYCLSFWLMLFFLYHCHCFCFVFSWVDVLIFFRRGRFFCFVFGRSSLALFWSVFVYLLFCCCFWMFFFCCGRIFLPTLFFPLLFWLIPLFDGFLLVCFGR